MSSLKLRYSIFVVFAISAGVALAEPGSEAKPDGRELVDRFVAGVHTMSGRFEQSLVDANDRIEEKSEGTFRIQRPGRFRWSYSEPYEQILVADGENLWSYDVDLAQVTVKPQSQVLGSTPALLLGGADSVLDDFDIVDSFSDRGTDWVRLVPRNPDGSFTAVELGFTENRLTRMIFYDELQQTTLVALFDVTVNNKIDPSEFEFTPPPGVDVVGSPATSTDQTYVPRSQ